MLVAGSIDIGDVVIQYVHIMMGLVEQNYSISRLLRIAMTSQ